MDFTDKTQFIELYSREHKKIFFYILGMVHHKSDAEDIMQQTASDMWRLFDRFEKGTNFAAWGIAIAKYKILDYRKAQKNNRIFLNNDIYEQVAKEFEYISKQSNERSNALRGCVAKLSTTDREILTMHYEEGTSYIDIAKLLNRSQTGIYKVMARIHSNLEICIKRTLLVWGENV